MRCFFVHELANVQPTVFFATLVFLTIGNLRYLITAVVISTVVAFVAQRFMSGWDNQRVASNEAIFITGTSSGIGHDAAFELAMQGYQVFATVRDAAHFERLQHPHLHPLICDVRIQSSIDSAVNKMRNKLQNEGWMLKAVILNAAYGEARALESVSIDEMRSQFETNIFGVHACCLATVDLLKRDASAESTSRLIFMSSIVARCQPAGTAPYSTTKAAVEALANCWRQEMVPFHIDVICIEPGVIQTRFFENIEQTRAQAGSLPAEVRAHYAQAQRRVLRAADVFPNTTIVTSHAITVSLHRFSIPNLRVISVRSARSSSVVPVLGRP